ncbi:MAG: transcriptional regulator [Betaproteobacteria bacterium]|nr:transcriptional regulator [Betaproteobacteria bacterium]NCP80732.1 transcriptional regulator [Rhodoferax sp.]NCS61097.1 transcriptional regulator [Rhodoferax sp.]
MIMTDSVLAPWAAVNTALGLSAPVRDEVHYTELLAFVEECFERFGAQDNHPIFALVDLVAQRINQYEDRLHPWPDASTPATRLAFLMDQHGLRQSDLPEVGAQSVVSDVLAGKRKLNLRQTQALARRFGVPVDALI